MGARREGACAARSSYRSGAKAPVPVPTAPPTPYRSWAVPPSVQHRAWHRPQLSTCPQGADGFLVLSVCHGFSGAVELFRLFLAT